MILKFILENLLLIHTGTLIARIKSSLLLSVFASPFAMLGDAMFKWFEFNIVYVQFVFGAIIIDHILGSYIHKFIKNDFSILENIKGLMIKCVLVVTVGYLNEGFLHILGKDGTLGIYLVVILKLMVFVYPAGSAWTNSSIITNGKFPPISWTKRINLFNKNLDIKDFQKKDDENNI
ncbi:hypothetical protein [Aquimarina intermedia]|uniref:Bacteriophage holin family protein n=1 Tax=Aquimarina intermedia TaxID=350814 RepID=A0A5S5BWR5_9FLAO|nr:hypothetical protein [Aquimarina intermedia]TYP71477.1 hypothetical protein BD809_10959 [Aquimarina intermedia]